MTIPDYQALMLPLLKRAALGELRVLEAEKLLGDDFGLTPEEREQLLPSGKQGCCTIAHTGQSFI
jgi:restriction system protein